MSARRDGDRLVVTDNFHLNPKQIEFRNAAHAPGVKEALFHGAIGSGKTQIGCRMIVGWAWRYGGTYVVSRGSYRELEDTTKKAMLVGDGGMPPACPPELIKKTYAHGSLNKVILKNGAEILFRSLEPGERGKVRNITAAGWFIDQAEELEDETDEELYDEIMGRLRDPNGPRRMVLVANPGAEDHWLARRFGVLPEWRHDRQPQTAHVHVSLLDNADHLPPDYVRSLLRTKDTRPDFYKRMVLGLWGSFGGRRFKIFDPAVHGVDRLPDGEVDPGWEVVAGLDWGYRNPFVYLSVVIDYEGRWWVVAEHYAAELRISKHAEEIKRIEANEKGYLGFHGQLSPSARWLDPTAFNRLRDETESHATALAENAIYCGKAQNDRLAGWNRMEEFLSERMADDLPRLRILTPNCPNLMRELPQLRIKPGTDDVEKVNDHSPDALRYVISSRMPTPVEQILTPEEAHTREEIVKRIVERSKAAPEIESVGL